jgi:hypothetical protein
MDSICKSSVMNLGNNPRVLGMEENAGGFGLPRVRTVRSFLPSNSMALRVAMKCIPLQGQELMKHQFQEAMTKGSARAGDNICLCATPVQWFQEGFGQPSVQGSSAYFNG